MIECRDVWYGYGAEPVLRGVDFTIPAGAAVLLTSADLPRCVWERPWPR